MIRNQVAESSGKGGGSSHDRRHLPELDGLRGIAIILVVAAHTMAGSLAIPGPWHRLGGLGVMLFFVLSGFLITGVLIASEEDHGRIELREFYTRRALRIFPAAYAFLAFMWVAVTLGLVTDLSWRSFVAAALYLRNISGRDISFGHLWSLSLEEQFYLIWPPVLMLTGCRRGLWVALVATLGFAAFRTFAIFERLFPYETGVFYERPWFRFDSLLIGCCFALLRHQSPGSWRRLISAVPSLASPLWIALAPATVAWTLWGEQPVWAHPLYLTIQMLLVALIFLSVLSTPTGIARNILTHPWLRTIGRLSYSLYLWQQIFIVTTTPSWGWLRRFPVNLALLVIAAYGSYTFIEKPFLRLKESKALQDWLAVDKSARPL